jgi:hypothetical protein
VQREFIRECPRRGYGWPFNWVRFFCSSLRRFSLLDRESTPKGRTLSLRDSMAPCSSRCHFRFRGGGCSLCERGLGALQTCILVVIMAGYILHLRPEATSVLQTLAYLARTIVCTMAIYALSVLLACVLDEIWQSRVRLFSGLLCFWCSPNSIGSHESAPSRHEPELLSDHRADSVGSDCGVAGVCRCSSVRIGADGAATGILIAFAPAAGTGSIGSGAANPGAIA